MDIITDSFEYYDKYQELYFDFIQKIATIELHGAKSDKCKIFDKNDNVIYDSTFEILGQYNNLSKIWVWSWALPWLPPNSTNISKKIIKYAVDLDIDKVYLKLELTTSRFKISNNLQIDMHMAISAYIAKQPLILIINNVEHGKTFILSKNYDIKETNDVNHVIITLTNPPQMT